MSEYLHVVVGVILDQNRNVLISQRSLTSHQGGLWEFPGGKIEAGETVQQALERELQEELGIVISRTDCFPFKKIRHHYSDKSVFLDVWLVNDFSGTPLGKEGQPIRWMPLSQLDPSIFPDANCNIVRALQLPMQIGITGIASGLLEFKVLLEKTVQKNIELVQFSQPTLSVREFLKWAEQAKSICEQKGARLMINNSPAVFQQSHADGLHLNSKQLLNLTSRPVPSNKLLGASCHNKQELRHAEAIGADFVFLSPVFETGSRPQGKTLGWNSFRDVAASVSLPVYALGGMTPLHLPQALKQGAFGCASINAFWGV